MEITKNPTSDLEGKLLIKITEKDYADKVDEELRKLRKKVVLKGFRPGQVPLTVVKKLYGKQVIAEQVDKLLNEELDKYVKENMNLASILLPVNEEIDFDVSKKDFLFVYEYGEYPNLEISLDDIEFDYYKIKITDEMIDKEIEALRNKYGELIEVEEATENSLLRVKAKELIDNEDNKKPIEVESLLAVKFLSEQGKNTFIGKKKGDKFIVNLKEAFANELDLKSFLNLKEQNLDEISDKFEIEILKIEDFKPAELNQEFYDKAFGKDTVHNDDEMREQIRKNLEQKNQYLEKVLFVSLARKKLLEKYNFDLPENYLRKVIGEKTSWEDIDKYYRWKYILDKLADLVEYKFDMNDLYEDVFDEYSAIFEKYGINTDIDKEAKAQMISGIIKNMDENQLAEKVQLTKELRIFNKLLDTKKIKVNVIEKEKEEIDKIVSELNKDATAKKEENNSETDTQESKQENENNQSSENSEQTNSAEENQENSNKQ